MKKVNHPISKRFKTITKQVDKDKTYPIIEAIELVKKTSTVKFDASIEAHIKLNINPKKSDQQIRNTVSLPHGTGKNVRVAVLVADGDAQKAAKEAGADIVGEKDLIDEIKKGKIDFDILIATPNVMKLLAPVAKQLGPKGLMPNPKDGTVTQNIAETTKNMKKGQISYKNDDSGNLHVLIGKASFESIKLQENFQTFINSIIKAKPSGVKGIYIKSISLASSMGPGIKVENL